MKKLISLVLALAMILMVGAAFAADAGSISVTKNFKGQEYVLYKLFDAVADPNRTATDTTGISYHLMSGKTDLKATVGESTVDGSQWFKVDTAGNVSLADGVSSISFDTDPFKGWAKAYGVKIGETLTATADDDTNIKWESLADGYYFITTTTGSLVTVDSIRPNVTVNDKNTVPTVDKKITGASDITHEGKKALAQIGTDVEFTAEVTVGKGSINLVFHDTMDAGLAFKAVSSVTADSESLTGTWYTVKDTPDQGDTLTITFIDGIAEGTKITIKYTATITAEAVTKLENDAFVSYGENNTKSEESKTETYNAKISVKKYDGAKANNKPLEGAGFKLKKSDTEYYKLDNGVVTWVAEANADEHLSDASGNVAAFTGLANGAYTLVESTVPAGYNKAADTVITIASGDYTAANLDQVAEVENNSGTELPSTGGIGTTIFYVVGGLLLVGAAIILVARRKANN